MKMWASARRHPWSVFTVIQVVGALCEAALPNFGDVAFLPFLSLLAGIVLLLPGSVIGMAFMNLIYPTGLTPKAVEILALMIAIVLNTGIFAGVARMKVRPNLGFGFRKWLLITGLSNATALVFIWFWFPMAGLDGLFEQPHVQRVVASAALTVLTMVVIAISLLLRRGFQPVSWIIVMVQFLRLLPATQAMKTWPGGDDGSGMGWAGIVIPFTWILALAGAGTCVWCSRRVARVQYDLANHQE